MKTAIEFIKEEIRKQKEMLDTDECLQSYRDELTNEEDKTPTSQLIMEADLEDTAFNIGFEQGYIRGMESILADLTQQ